MQKVKTMAAKIISSLAILTAMTGGFVAFAPSAQALDCAVLPGDICNKANDGTTNGGVFELLKWVLRIMVTLVGIAAVGGVIWAGILYLTAGDNASQTKQAKTIIIDVVIGLIAFALMFLVANWLIPGGVIG